MLVGRLNGAPTTDKEHPSFAERPCQPRSSQVGRRRRSRAGWDGAGPRPRRRRGWRPRDGHRGVTRFGQADSRVRPSTGRYRRGCGEAGERGNWPVPVVFCPTGTQKAPLNRRVSWTPTPPRNGEISQHLGWGPVWLPGKWRVIEEKLMSDFAFASVM